VPVICDVACARAGAAVSATRTPHNRELRTCVIASLLGGEFEIARIVYVRCNAKKLKT
jgi:hypothetical protein